MLKKEISKRFKKEYEQEGLRLLAVQLNGFSHKVFFDNGDNSSKVSVAEYSAYASEHEARGYRFYEMGKLLLGDIAHYEYQDNPKEIIYIMPKD